GGPASALQAAPRYIAILLAASPLMALAANWDEAAHRHYTYAEDFVRATLDHVAPGALILSPDWTFISPAFYLQHGENVRPDVTVLDGELLRRSWYFSYVRRRAPWLYDACKPTIDAFLIELAKYENNKPFD